MLEADCEIKTQVIGPVGETTGKVLNPSSLASIGFGHELEADQRHSEIIAEQFGVNGLGGITTV